MQATVTAMPDPQRTARRTIAMLTRMGMSRAAAAETVAFAAARAWRWVHRDTGEASAWLFVVHAEAVHVRATTGAPPEGNTPDDHPTTR